MTVLAIASFDAEGPFLRARLRALAAERRIVGEWTPYASEVLDGADGARGILAAAIGAGIAGAGALFALTAWSAMVAYPFDSGGRPAFSWPAFLPAPVEFGALAAAIGVLVMLFRKAGLTRLHHPAFDLPEVADATQGRFVLALACDAEGDANAALVDLAMAGAVHSRIIER